MGSLSCKRIGMVRVPAGVESILEFITKSKGLLSEGVLLYSILQRRRIYWVEQRKMYVHKPIFYSQGYATFKKSALAAPIEIK
jgi:hypothetical protein